MHWSYCSLALSHQCHLSFCPNQEMAWLAPIWQQAIIWTNYNPVPHHTASLSLRMLMFTHFFPDHLCFVCITAAEVLFHVTDVESSEHSWVGIALWDKAPCRVCRKVWDYFGSSWCRRWLVGRECGSETGCHRDPCLGFWKRHHKWNLVDWVNSLVTGRRIDD